MINKLLTAIRSIQNPKLAPELRPGLFHIDDFIPQGIRDNLLLGAKNVPLVEDSQPWITSVNYIHWPDKSIYAQFLKLSYIKRSDLTRYQVENDSIAVITASDEDGPDSELRRVIRMFESVGDAMHMSVTPMKYEHGEIYRLLLIELNH